MKRCLVTGIAGFIGSSIAQSLLTSGYQVRGIDNLSTGSDRNLDILGPHVEFHHGDIRDQKLMNRLCRDVDTVFHQAAIASVQRSLEDPLGTWDVNVMGTSALLASAIRAGVRRIVFASSSAVYGEACYLPSTEASPFNPLSPYAAHKLTGELLLRNACLNNRIETVSLRYFNVFGPRQSPDSPYSGAIASFAKAMLAPSASVRLFGDGLQTRDFVYIADVVQANLAAMEAPASRVAGEAFNIGTGTAHTILQTAQTMAHLTGHLRPFLQEPPRPGDVPHSLADIRLAASALNYRPTTSFAQGLFETIEWMRRTQYPPTPSAPFPYRTADLQPAHLF